MVIDERFTEALRVNGWKCTSQRVAVYEFICDNHEHPSVDAVWYGIRGRLPSITRESVYRILNEFSQSGLIYRMDHLDSARYDSRTGPHGHFICEKCRNITDFDIPAGVSVPSLNDCGEVHHMELRVRGVCAVCKNTKE